MAQTLDASTVQVKSLGQIDDEKVSTMLAEFFSNNWMRAKGGDVSAAVELQHYADRAGQYGESHEMTKRILEKMEPTAASKLKHAIETGSVISFEP